MSSQKHTRWRGYYAVLDRDDPALAEALLAATPCAIQVRMKDAPPREILTVASWLGPMARARGVALVINDRIDLALAAGADAVHLGQDDLPLAVARRIVQEQQAPLAIGISTHQLAQVRAACEGGADYVGFGPVFATATKANPDPVVGLEALAAAVAEAGAAEGGAVPVVAIGGISLGAVADVVRAGAAAACVIGAVNGANASARSAAHGGDGRAYEPIAAAARAVAANYQRDISGLSGDGKHLAT